MALVENDGEKNGVTSLEKTESFKVAVGLSRKPKASFLREFLKSLKCFFLSLDSGKPKSVQLEAHVGALAPPRAAWT